MCECEEARNERAKALDDLNALSEEVLDLTFPAVALDQPVPDYQANHCPFPGLKAFQTDDEPYFFGRDEAVGAQLKRLKADRFLAVLGISGSGKSSLVLAGLVPKLRDQVKDTGQMLDYRILTPGSDPEAALRKQLQAPLPAAQPALLIVDQFEELFTLSTDPKARGRFLDQLLAIGKEHPDLQTILTQGDPACRLLGRLRTLRGFQTTDAGAPGVAGADDYHGTAQCNGTAGRQRRAALRS